MSQRVPRIFLDTSTLKYSVDELTRFVKVTDTITWPNSETAKLPVYQLRKVYPNEKLTGKREELRLETYKLPFIAHLAKISHVRLLCHFEVFWELMGLPNITAPQGRFYGAPIEVVESPFRYGRVLSGPSWPDVSPGRHSHLKPSKRRTAEFFEKITDPRFKELQSACGVQQGSKRVANQLLDAFHIYCAEKAGADFFLTCERVLVEQVRQHKRHPPTVTVVRPSELLECLLTRRPFAVLGQAIGFWLRR